MTLKKTLSLALALVLVLGLFATVPHAHAEETAAVLGAHEITSIPAADYVVNTDTKENTETSKLKYYLAAELDGAKYYFDDTAKRAGTPSCVGVTTDIAKATGISLVDRGSDKVAITLWNEAGTTYYMYLYLTAAGVTGRTRANRADLDSTYFVSFAIKTEGTIHVTVSDVENVLVCYVNDEAVRIGFVPTATVTADTTGKYAYVRLAEACTPGAEWSKGDPAVATDDQANHWKVCSVCNEKIGVAEHNFGEPVNNGQYQISTCATCGYELKVDVHTCAAAADAKLVDDKDGSHYLPCQYCGLPVEGTKVAHTFAAEQIEKNAAEHAVVCECGAADSNAAHTYGEWTVKTAATTSAEGEKIRTCADCGFVESAKIPKVENTFLLTNGTYYFLEVGDTNNGSDYHTLATTTDAALSHRITVISAQRDGKTVYHLQYKDDAGTTRYIYVDDIGGDGVIDVGRSANTDKAQRVDFLWDKENNCLYQMEGDVKYVLSIGEVEVKGEKQMRIIAVPAAELQAGNAVSLINNAGAWDPDRPVATGDNAMLTLAGVVMALSAVAAAALVTKKKYV